MIDLTQCAAQGYDFHKSQAPLYGENSAGLKSYALAFCPYLNTSDAANAWHLGRALAAWEEKRPTPGMKPRESKDRIAITAGRGDLMNMRGYGDILLRRFRRLADNSFVEAR